MKIKIDLLETYLPLVEPSNDYKIFAFYGGRGGGKTVGITDAHIINALKNKCIQFCGRVIKDANDTSMDLSFRKRLSVLESEGRIPLNCYKSTQKKITFYNGSEIYFKGFNDITINNIKSSSANSVWIDECETLTASTIDTLIPSILEGKTKIIFSFNRQKINDPVYTECSTRQDCYLKKINYYNNPYFKDNETLNKLLEEDKRRVKEGLLTEIKFNHIWNGQPFVEEDVMIPMYLINKSLEYKGSNYKAFAPVMGVDVATSEGNDYSVLLIRQGNKILDIIKKKGLDGRDLAQQILIYRQRYNVGYILIDSVGVGASPCDFLKREFRVPFIPVNFGERAEDSKYYNKRTESYSRVRQAFEEGFELMNDLDLINQLQYIPFDIQVNDKIKLKKKEEIRKVLGCSPDVADALALSYSYFVNDFGVVGSGVKSKRWEGVGM